MERDLNKLVAFTQSIHSHWLLCIFYPDGCTCIRCIQYSSVMSVDLNRLTATKTDMGRRIGHTGSFPLYFF